MIINWKFARRGRQTPFDCNGSISTKTFLSGRARRHLSGWKNIRSSSQHLVLLDVTNVFINGSHWLHFASSFPLSLSPSCGRLLFRCRVLLLCFSIESMGLSVRTSKECFGLEEKTSLRRRCDANKRTDGEEQRGVDQR